MKTPQQIVWLALVPLALALTTAGALAQVDQRTIAQQLLDQDNVAARNKALDMAQTVGAQNASPELRAALMTTLAREGQRHAERYEAGRRGEELEPMADPEFIARVSRVVIELQDPQTIPALTGALATGIQVPRALARFGEQAAPAVLRTVADPDGWYDAVGGGLITLRFMVEGAATRPLSSGVRDQIRRVAKERLTGKQHFTILWRAIDLASVLKDAELTRIVETIASDANEVAARGVDDPEVVELTQKRAADLIAGKAPLPRP